MKKFLLVRFRIHVKYTSIRTDCRSRVSAVEYTDNTVRQCFKEHGGQWSGFGSGRKPPTISGIIP
jgi:hypothetical protein